MARKDLPYVIKCCVTPEGDITAFQLLGSKIIFRLVAVFHGEVITIHKVFRQFLWGFLPVSNKNTNLNEWIWTTAFV